MAEVMSLRRGGARVGGAFAAAWSILVAKIGVLTAALCVVALAGAPAAQAANVEAATALVQETSQELLALAEEDISNADKRLRVQEILNERADVARISRLTVGRKWRDMSEQQRIDYQNAIIPYVANRFVSSFNDFRGGALKVRSSTTTTVGSEQRVMVNAIGRRPASSEATDLLWVITELDGRVVVLDVRIEKLSLVVQLRNEIATNLNSVGGDFDKLIAQLRSAVS